MPSTKFALFPTAIAIVTLVYIMLALHMPVSIFTGAEYDDAWFFGKAENLLSGSWLGSYDKLTLIKGPGFSYFLALNALLGTPITFSIAALFASACFFLSYELRRAGLHLSLAILLYIILLFQPVLFPMRVIRDDICFSLMLIAFAGFIHIFTAQRKTLVLLGLSGLSFGFFWITREEGAWVLPGFAVLVLFFLLASFRKNDVPWLPVTKAVAIYIAAALVLPSATSAVNFAKYGEFVTVEFKHTNFSRALGSLYSVVDDTAPPYVPVAKAKRLAIYTVSPTFAQLQSYFEDPANGWRQYGCVPSSESCGEYAAGWFMWALRDGADSLGTYKSATQSEEFFGKISNEIASACAQKRLICASGWLSVMPQLSRQGIMDMPSNFWNALRLTTYQQNIGLDEGASWTPPDRMTAIQNFLGNPQIVPTTQVSGTLVGWYYNHSSDWISLRCDNKPDEDIEIARSNSPDIAQHFQDTGAASQRFSVTVPDVRACRLHFKDGAASDLRVSEIVSNRPQFLAVGAGILTLDPGTSLNQGMATGSKIGLTIKALLYRIYGFATPVIFVLGSVASGATAIIVVARRNRPNQLFGICIALWTLYYSRIILLLIVNATGLPAINYLYMLPAYPLMMAASVCALGSLVQDLSLWRQMIRPFDPPGAGA